MPKLNDLHPKAMDLADLAFRHQRKGEEVRAKQLFYEAFHLERKAAALLPAAESSEPSRSILYRSAASLAYNAGEYEAADRLVASGLAGYPPPEIQEELRVLYDDVNFMRHLSAKGVQLTREQWLMTLSGNATSHGGALVDHLIMRVEKLSTLFYRTVERLLKLPYRTNGGVSKELKEVYGLYVNAFLPGSFAVSFQLGRPDPQLVLLPGFEPVKPVESEAVIDEVLRCFEILERDETEVLRRRFDDEIYFENFVGLAKQIAPDGDAIKLVGFTTIRDGKEKPVALRRNRQQLRQATRASSIDQTATEGIRTTYRGILKYASSPDTRKHGTVKLKDLDSANTYKIRVPIAIMKDVVQPFYEERVSVVVLEKGNEKYLEEVTLEV
jgi:hypothetical protein